MKIISKYTTLLVLALFIGLALTYWGFMGNPFKKPLTVREDPMDAMLQEAGTAVKNEDWKRAQQLAEQVNAYFRKIKMRVTLVADQEEFLGFERDLDQLRAATELEERTDAYLAVVALRSRWAQLGDPK